jgi:hypothetical protein
VSERFIIAEPMYQLDEGVNRFATIEQVSTE